MPRKPREEVEGGVHHVYARGNRQQAIYLDDTDREAYLSMLGREVARHRWLCLAYCLMPNHVHLIIETPQPNLGRGMQRLHGLYAQTFNVRHARSGHLFQGRFGSVRVTDDEQLSTVLRYVARNPVEAGLCGSPGDWPWGSHGAIVGHRWPAWLDARRLLAYFDAVGGDSFGRYRELVETRGE